MKLRNYFFLFFMAFLFGECVFSQEEYTLHFNRNLVQSNHTNPAIRHSSRIGILLPSFAFNFGNNAFAYNDLIKQNPIYDSLYIDVDGVIEGMQDENILQSQAQLELFALYLNFESWYFSLYYSEKADFRFTYPKDLVDLLWNGNAKFIGQTIEIGPGLKASYYKELKLTVGKSFEKWDVGLSSKLLFGMANFTSAKNDLYLTTGKENYSATLSTDYEIRTSGTENPLANALRFPRSTLNPGFAFDLGAIYHLNDKWEFSQSILNLGGINWKNDVVTYRSKGSFKFSGVDINEFIDNEDDISFDQYSDSLKDLYFEEEAGGRYWSALSPESYTSALFKPDEHTYLGAMIHLAQFYGTRFGFSMYAGREFFKFIDLGFSWSYKNRQFNNVGFNLGIGPKEYKIFVVTDNLMNFLSVRGGQNVTFRYGMNINLGNAKLGKRKKNKSKKEVPQMGKDS